ncbi:MAG: RNA polymerase sigma factor [Chromatiales bacterium 21-64-14]|nr:MAG: RNA polymerase sigma factor [Chromatiales bacterium 21-64-14]
MDRFLAGIERRALRMAEFATGSRDASLDLVQDAMMRLVQRYATRPSEQWPPLFHRILQNGIRDWYRREGLRRRLRLWIGGQWDPHQEDAGADPMDTLPDHQAVDPLDGLADGQAMEALERALRALPRRQQQTFLLRAWEGLGVADTARVMGCSEGSVKTHYSRAVHALRKQLEAHWP